MTKHPQNKKIEYSQERKHKQSISRYKNYIIEKNFMINYLAGVIENIDKKLDDATKRTNNHYRRKKLYEASGYVKNILKGLYTHTKMSIYDKQHMKSVQRYIRRNI